MLPLPYPKPDLVLTEFRTETIKIHTVELVKWSEKLGVKEKECISINIYGVSNNIISNFHEPCIRF